MANAHLNALVQPPNEKIEAAKRKLQTELETVQNYLFELGAHLATPRPTSTASKITKTVFPENASSELETWIDEMDAGLGTLSTFILPGGSLAAAALHLARTIARRAERALTPLFIAGEEIDECAYCFVNRLSDYLFVASRHANCIMSIPDKTCTNGIGKTK